MKFMTQMFNIWVNIEAIIMTQPYCDFIMSLFQ